MLPWKAVDSAFGPVYQCALCDQPLTRSFDASRPSEKECPNCGFTLDRDDDRPYSGTSWIGQA